VKIELYCAAGKDIGILEVRVEFEEFKDQTVEKTRIENFDINWKDSKLLEPKSNEYINKVVFYAYDGSQQSFGKPDLSDRSVLKTEAEGNGKWKIWAEPPKDLQLDAESFETKASLGTLPQLAGEGITEFLSKQSERITQHTSSQEFNYNGNNWYPEHWHTKYEHIRPHSGWFIDVAKKPDLVVNHIHGLHKEGIMSHSADEIVVKIQLYCATGHDIGIMSFRVEFDEYKDQTVEKTRIDNFKMYWKNSKLLEPKSNEYINKVVFLCL